MRFKKWLRLSGYLTTVFLVALIAWNFQDIQDWWYLKNYRPSPAIASLTRRVKFSDHGKKLFYLYDPQLLNKKEFAENCTFDEYAIVVGCYDGKKVYVLDITNKKLEPGEVVTAAHEMLHVAYDRLSSDERKRVNSLLTKEEKKIKDKQILASLKLYKKGSPTEYLNEVHSVIGTELAGLGAELGTYYKQYFSNRQSLVKIARDYNEIFAKLQREADSLSKRLNTLASELNKESNRLSAIYDDLQVDRKALQQRIDRGEASQSLSDAIALFDSRVISYNNRVEAYKVDASRYKTLKARYDAVALRHEELVKSIDFHYNPVELKE